MAYARGLKSQGICDRCGFQYDLHTLRMEWTGLKVCHDCFEPKHPQLSPRASKDETGLYQPRPGSHNREDCTVRIIHGQTAVAYVGEFNLIAVDDSMAVSGFEITSALGTINLFITTDIFLTGFEITSALGTVGVSISDLVAVSGFTITSNTPNVGVSVDDNVLPAGLASTTSLGTVLVTLDSGVWGLDTWGAGAWGQ